MELFKNIRLNIGKSILAKRDARTKRKVHYSSFNQVKNIGIVWDASKPDDFGCISRFYQRMHERNIEVKVLGYFPGKNLPDQYTAIRYLTCLRKKEIDVFYKPVSSESSNFVNNRFDILIDINFRKLFPLHYITVLSNSLFKVGLFESDANETPYDLMMEIKNPVELDNYLSQIIQYLEMINSGTVNKLINN